MNVLEDTIQDGSIIAVVLLVLLIETIALAALRVRTGRGLPMAQVIGNACAGGCLALATRSAIIGEGTFWVGLWLVLGGIAHVTDLTLRFRAADGPG